MIRNIQISAFVDYSQPFKTIENDKYIIEGAKAWLRLGIIPCIAITPDSAYLQFINDLPPETILGLKIGNRMKTLDDIDGAKYIADAIAKWASHGEIRLENETLLQNSYWNPTKVPTTTAIATTFAEFPTTVSYVWQTGFFEAFSLGQNVPQARTFTRMKTLAKVLRKTLNARFVTNELAKPPTIPSTVPGKSDTLNNDWWSDAAAAAAAPYIDADHPAVCQVYANDAYGKGGKTCRYWERSEYPRALNLARQSGYDIAFDMAYQLWNSKSELDAWEHALTIQK